MRVYAKLHCLRKERNGSFQCDFEVARGRRDGQGKGLHDAAKVAAALTFEQLSLRYGQKLASVRGESDS